MLRFAPDGLFFAFEPLPELFEYLRSRFGSDPRVRLYNLALSDTNGMDCFQHYLDEPALSGFRRTDLGRPWGNVETINVKKDRLDDILGDNRVDMVKIDVEGAELQVLRGARETLSRYKPYVLFEHGEAAAQYDTQPEDIFDLLADCGLKISLLDKFLSGGPTLSKSGFAQISKSNSEFYFLGHE
jgi:FkbM family methyltransferase